MNQTDITNQILSKVIEPVYLGRGRWEKVPVHVVLLSLTRQRPRDLVKLMHGAAGGGGRKHTYNFRKPR